MKIWVSGYSDDCIEVNTNSSSDEFSAYRVPGWMRVQRPNGEGLMIFAQYAPEDAPDGTWVIGITLLGEDKVIPDWPVSYSTCENGYSPVLTIEAPDDAILKYTGEQL